MKYLKIKDKNKRPYIISSQEEKKYLKSCKANSLFILKLESKRNLEQIPIKIPKNRCIVTGRGKAILSDFKLSRLEFYRNYSKLPGLDKGSW